MIIQCNSPAVGRDTLHWIILLKAPSNLTSNTSSDGTPSSQGKLCQYYTNFLLNCQSIPTLSQLKPLPCVLSLQILFKKLSLSDKHSLRTERLQEGLPRVLSSLG